MQHSQAAERNQNSIGDALQAWFSQPLTVLEVGSGTGQHAVYFCQRFAKLRWWPTDRAENIADISQRLALADNPRIGKPTVLDVAQPSGALAALAESGAFDMAYSANTAHIMSLDEVRCMFTLVGAQLNDNGVFALYGPFSENGKHNAESNAQFDWSLRHQAAHMGVRDIVDLKQFAGACGLSLQDDISMPSNNRILLWSRHAEPGTEDSGNG